MEQMDNGGIVNLVFSIIYTTVTDKTQASIIVKQFVNDDMILCEIL